MKIKILASGSKGNCTLVECGNVKFLIDVGISYLQLKKVLLDLNLDVSDLEFIVITHSHSDHIKGLRTLVSKTKIKVYLTEELILEMNQLIEQEKINILPNELKYEGIEIKSFPLSHDVPCYGFYIEYENRNFVYITDTGYLNRRYFKLISNANLYIIESNYDEKKLMEGNYPYILKQRILSDKGHLSNSMTADILKKVIGHKTKFIFLAHLSEENNSKDIAYETTKKVLENINFDLNNLIIADQYLSTETVEI